MSDPEERPRRDLPSADALDAAVRLARLRRTMFDRVETPRIAHYHVLRQTGGGGMGLVFAAWDPKLDRVVAIKVLRDAWPAEAGTALRREAMALAKLRHPNVVSVFEVGEHEGQMYLAMEYVEGITLRTWTKQWRDAPRRRLKPLLDVFLQAAQGLVAAHAAGLVHRDVKPENVMIEPDGRVRLMDFGLARPDPSDDAVARTLSGSGSDAETITHQSLGLRGTPAYMAPEQFGASPAGPAADQFALCACLFEALAGRRARPDRLDEAARVAAQPVDIGSEPGIPRRVLRIVRRGLAIDPAERWPSMQVLADELARARSSSRDRWVLLSSAIVAIAGIGGGVSLASRNPDECSGGASALAGVWDDARKQALAANFEPAEASFAAAAWQAVVLELDAYRSAWIESHRDACEAAQIRGEISTAQMDRRMACLADRRRHLTAIVDLVERGGLPALASADEAIAGLPSLQQCSDPEYVDRQGYVADPEREAWLGDRLARATVLHDSGDLEAARTLADRALAEIEGSGDPGSEARVLLALGRTQAALRESSEARERLISAYEAARRAELPDVAAQAALALIGVCGIDLSRHDEGFWWSRMAELESAELDDARLRARRELATAVLLQAAGRGDEAMELGARAIATLEGVTAEGDRGRLWASMEVGQLEVRTGALERGRARIDAAAEALRELLGPEHPANAKSEQALALVARLRGDFAKAIEHSRRAVTLAEAGVGTDHISLWPYLESLANGRAQMGEIDEALAVLDRAMGLGHPRPLPPTALAKLHGRRGEVLVRADPRRSFEAYERAYEISRATVGELHRDSVQYLVAKAAGLGAIGRSEEATEALQLGLALGRAVLGSRHPIVGSIHHDVAREYERQGKTQRALEHNLAALDILTATHGPDAYPLVAEHGNVCANLVDLRRADEALVHCERALELSSAAVADPTRVRAEVHNNLGAALSMLERYDEAEAAFATALTRWEQALGRRSYEVTIALANLGEVAERRGDRSRCSSLYREALAIREEIVGSGHPALTVPREGLERCRRPSPGRP